MLNDENFNITLKSNVLHPKNAMLSYQAFLGRTDGNKHEHEQPLKTSIIWKIVFFFVF